MSFCCHNVIDAHNVFMNKSIYEMICQGRNAFMCNIMQTIQSSVKVSVKGKSHVHTARESHDMNMDFYGFKHSCPKNSMQECLFDHLLPKKKIFISGHSGCKRISFYVSFCIDYKNLS